MHFDNCYLSYLRRANLLPITNIIHRGMPDFNAPAITTMVDRWRSETHSFHLPCDKMTVTLENVAMILGLPIRGQTVTDLYDPVGWHRRVADFLGRNPLDRPECGNDREARVHISWLHQEFQHCPRVPTLLQCPTTREPRCGTCLELRYFHMPQGGHGVLDVHPIPYGLE
jgi:hypothetical protein